MRDKQKATIIVLLLLGLVLLFVAWITYKTITKNEVKESEAGQALLGSEGDETRYIGLQGQAVALDEKVGSSALYINSWASWSPLSRDELIALNKVAGEYKDKGVTFIALNRKEPKEQAERYLATLPPLDNLQIVIDSSDRFYSKVDGYAMPETIIYTQEGELYRHERQPLSEESMRRILDEFLTQP